MGFSNFKTDINVIKSNFKVLIWMLAISYILYSFFINNNLVNTYDGLWRGNSHIANEWEIMQGRFFIPVLSILRLGIAIEPLISILSLFYLCFGLYLILIIFNMVNKRGVLLSLLTISSSTVCIWLSYRYLSTTYSFGFLFAVIASYILIRFAETNILSYILKLLLSSILIMLSLALYQTQIAVTLLIVMIYFIIYTYRNQNKSLYIMLKPLIDLVISVVIGMIIYKCLWDIVLKFMHIKAAAYQGANNLHFTDMLYNIPNKFINSFINFYSYFSGKSFKSDALNLYIVGWLLIIIAIMLMFYKLIKKRVTLLELVVVVVDLLLIPSVLSITTFLAVTTEEVAPQGTIGFATLFTIIGMALFNLYDFNSYKKSTIAILAVFIIILYGRLNQILVDTFAMYDYRNASISLANQIISRIDNLYCQNPGSEINPTNNVVFLGIPVKNELFKVTTHSFRRLNNRDCINSFAKVGYFRGNVGDEDLISCLQFSYEGLIDKIMGIDYVADNGKYIRAAYLYDDEIFKSRKPFPSYESIFDIDGTVYVKVSD